VATARITISWRAMERWPGEIVYLVRPRHPPMPPSTGAASPSKCVWGFSLWARRDRSAPGSPGAEVSGRERGLATSLPARRGPDATHGEAVPGTGTRRDYATGSGLGRAETAIRSTRALAVATGRPIEAASRRYKTKAIRRAIS
jgi:hypothetical protein